MKNQLELPDLQKFIDTEDVTYASSSRERKKLTCDLKGCLRVTVAHKLVYEGINPSDAVKAYNAITEKFKEDESIKNFRI
jgi:hypothetical protein